jgi:hypothetical protein
MMEDCVCGDGGFSEGTGCVIFQSLFLLSFRRKALISPHLYSSAVDELDLEGSEAAGPDRIGSGKVRRPRQWVSEIE